MTNFYLTYVELADLEKLIDKSIDRAELLRFKSKLINLYDFYYNDACYINVADDIEIICREIQQLIKSCISRLEFIKLII